MPCFLKEEGSSIVKSPKISRSIFSILSRILSRRWPTPSAQKIATAPVQEDLPQPRYVPKKKEEGLQTAADPFKSLYREADQYMKRKVEPHLPSQFFTSSHVQVCTDESLQTARKLYLDMNSTFYPATLLSALVLSLRDAKKPFTALDPTGEVPVESLMRVLAADVFGAKARATLLCQNAGVDHATRTRLGAEISAAGPLLKGLATAVGVPIPKDETQDRVMSLQKMRQSKAAHTIA